MGYIIYHKKIIKARKMNKFKLAFISLMAYLAVPVLAVVWTETEDSNGSIRKFTDSNFVIAWQSNLRIYYDSHDASKGTVLDLTTFCEDVEAAGYTAPNGVNGSAFYGKAGITRIILSERMLTIYQNAFTSCSDLESVVLPSQIAWTPSNNPKQVFSSCGKLSTITPRGTVETNGVVYLPETCTAIPNNMFQACQANGIKKVIAPSAVWVGEAAFQNLKSVEEIILSKDIHTIRNLACNYAESLKKFTCGDNTFPKLTTFEGQQNFQGCTKLESNFDFSSSTFTSVGLQSFNGLVLQEEIRLPATLTYFGKQALRSDNMAVQRRIWFNGAPPEFYYASNDADYALWGSNIRQIVLVPEKYADEWIAALSMDGATFNAITDADKARDDFPSKQEGLEAKAVGTKYRKVPYRIKESDVLGTTNGRARWNNSGRPYYLVKWREVADSTIICIF